MKPCSAVACPEKLSGMWSASGGQVASATVTIKYSSRRNCMVRWLGEAHGCGKEGA